MLLRGSCHCRNITFELDWSPEPATIPARACTCSFCRKHGGVWTSCPGGHLKVAIESPAEVSVYTFGTRTADFHVCARCGTVPVVSSLVDGRLHAVVSVNALDGVDPALFSHAPASFDGEAVGDRLARRARHWIRRVEFTTPGG